MRRIARPLGAVLVLVLWVCSLPALAQQAVTVSALLLHPEQYDGKTISVVGTVARYQERVSARGNPYTTFRLEDGGAVSVFAWHHQGLRDGLRVRVVGTFFKVRRVGRYVFRNEVEAQRIEAVR